MPGARVLLPTPAPGSSDPMAFLVDDSLSELQREKKYCASQLPLQRLIFTRRLAAVARLYGVAQTVEHLLPLLPRLAGDKEDSVRQAVGIELAALAGFLANPLRPAAAEQKPKLEDEEPVARAVAGRAAQRAAARPAVLPSQARAPHSARPRCGRPCGRRCRLVAVLASAEERRRLRLQHAVVLSSRVALSSGGEGRRDGGGGQLDQGFLRQGQVAAALHHRQRPRQRGSQGGRQRSGSSGGVVLSLSSRSRSSSRSSSSSIVVFPRLTVVRLCCRCCLSFDVVALVHCFFLLL